MYNGQSFMRTTMSMKLCLFAYTGKAIDRDASHMNELFRLNIWRFTELPSIVAEITKLPFNLSKITGLSFI